MRACGRGHLALATGGVGLDGTWPLFERVAQSPVAFWWLPEPAWFAVPLALAGGFWLLLPRGVPGKPLALLLWLPLLWPQRGLPEPGVAELVVVDVGQGLSVLVRTAGHTLLYDMGPGKPDGYDAGASVVVPALHALGVRRLDAAIVSHGDNDHAGGFASVVGAFPPRTVYTPAGMPRRDSPTSDCLAGTHWSWDGVTFRFLHPPRWFPYLDNEASCVMRIEAGGQVALLPGDIGQVIERRLVRNDAQALRADVVLVAHHGSHNSSDPLFIAATRARHALVSAGYANRFGHPDPDVVTRWQAAGAQVAGTYATGAQRLWLGRGVVAVEAERARRRRLWDAVAGFDAPRR